jgi:M6 family metalloprotease-like protein
MIKPSHCAAQEFSRNVQSMFSMPREDPSRLLHLAKLSIYIRRYLLAAATPMCLRDAPPCACQIFGVSFSGAVGTGGIASVRVKIDISRRGRIHQMSRARVRERCAMNRLVCYILAVILIAIGYLHGAPLKDVPVTVVQPSGDTLHILASGDEFHNWLHDAEQFTIIQDHVTGYYTYAVRSKGGERLEPSAYIVGKADPKLLGLAKALNISLQAYQIKRAVTLQSVSQQPRTKAFAASTLNNLVIFIRFNGEPEFSTDRGYYDVRLNSDWQGAVSLYTYFQEASYGLLTITSAYFPPPNGGDIVSYEDAHPRGYYEPYDATTNPIGYTGDQWNREETLCRNAIADILPQIPVGLNIDSDDDGVVDNVTFILSGGPTGWSSLLWPHGGSLNADNVWIHGKQVRAYTLQLEGTSDVGTLCHEMAHTLDAPDLYRFSADSFSPVGPWDLMGQPGSTPQEIGAYVKSEWMHLLGSIPEVTRTGTYSLYPLATSTRCAYKIRSPYADDQFYVTEYRKKAGTFDGTLPTQGLLVYRICPRLGGNQNGPPDGVYIYRPNGTPTANGNVYNAPLSVESGHTGIGPTTNPIPFLLNGQDGGLLITGVSSIGDQMSFTVSLPGGPGASPPLLAYYPISGGIAADSSGNRYGGAVSGATPVADRFNNAQQALDFNGTSNKLSGTYIHAPVNNVSVSLWLKTDLVSSSKYECLIGDAGNHQGFRIYRDTPHGDSIHFEVEGGHSWAQAVSFRLEPKDQGRWVHLVGVSFAGVLKIYKNGVLQDSATCPLGDSQMGWADFVGMGFDAFANTGFWTGSLDDIRLYKCALTEEEIQDLYRQGDWPRCPILAAPPDTGTTVSTSPMLSWHAPDGALSYRVQLSLSPSFDTLAYDSSGISLPSHQVSWLSCATKYFWRIVANYPGGDSASSPVWSFATLDGPYFGNRISLPGTVEAECFDGGGEGIAYHDTDPENLGASGGSICRTAEGVDTEPCHDPEGGRFNVAWTRPGEWLHYSVTVSQTGLYGVEMRVATPWPGRLHLELDGINITGPVAYGNTGGWQSWVSVRDTVMLIGGDHFLQLIFDDTASSFYAGNINQLRFTRLAPLNGTMDLLVSDRGGISETLSFGFVPGASDGLDAVLGEAPLGPVPGADVFDARFVLPTLPAIGSLTDLRKDTNSTVLWKLIIQAGAAGYPMALRWSKPDALSGGLRLENGSGTAMIDIDMELDSIYVLSNPGITSFSIRYSPVARPNLISPNNSAVNVGISPHLIWLTARDVAFYHVQLAADTMLEKLVVDTTVAATTTFSAPPLAHDGVYWWRVRAVDGDTLSDWTPLWHFRTIVQLPAKVSPVYPLDGSTVGSDSVHFSWKPSEPAVTRYWFEAAADSLFRFSVVDSSLVDTSTTIHGLTNGQSCWWKVAAGNAAGWGAFYPAQSFKVVISGVGDVQQLPKEFRLAQNYPNPFNPTTTVTYDVPHTSRISIAVFDLLGRLVAQLVDGTIEPGRHQLIFSAATLASGVYVVRMQADSFSDSKKIVLLR